MPDYPPGMPGTPPIKPTTTGGGGFLSSILGVGSQLLGGLFGNWSHNRDRNEALDDWNRQNEYNSPAAQMKRYTDAGLNPQLIYGQGTPGNASATPVSTQKSGNADFKPDLQEIYGDARRLEANMQQVQQTVENLKTNNQLMQANMELSKQMLEQRGDLLPYRKDEIDAKINSMNSSAQYKNNMLEPSLANMYLNQSLNKQRNDREERLLKSNLSLNSTREQQMQKQTALTIQQTAKSFYDTAISKTKSSFESKLLTQQSEKLYAEINNIIQGRQTSISVENLNKIRGTLIEYETGHKPIGDVIRDLSGIISIFKK